MRGPVSRIAAFALSAFALAASARAQSPVASVREISGKVDAMLPGKAWEPAAVGQKLGKGTQIATGFRSSATLALGDSLLSVKPLTQMTVEKLVQTGNLVKTEVYLRVGKVKADVVTPQGLKNDFKLKSPTATASVRGTAFEFDGDTLFVERGTVVMIAASGAERPVKQGEGTKVERSGAVTAPRDEAAAETRIESLREAVAAHGQDPETAPIEVPASVESAAAVVEEVAPEPVPVAIVEADGTITILRPGQAFPAGLVGALLVVSAGPPVLIYPSMGSVALTIGASLGSPPFASGLVTVVPTLSLLRPAASFPAAPAQGSPTLSVSLPAAAFGATPDFATGTLGAAANPSAFAYPGAPDTGSLGLSVE